MNFLSNWLAKITKKGSEELSFPIQQFEMNGRIGDAYTAAPYGMHSNLPEGQPALNISPDGTILMGIDPVGRIKVESGEVVFYHPVTKSKIHFKNNKDIDIETETDINATCDNANITAKTKATVTAPDIDLTGNVNITGTLDVSGVSTFAANIVAQANVAVTGALTQGGKDVGKDHNHTQGNDSGGNVEQNTGGVV